MAINREHINKVFGQKYSLLDKKNLERYFEDSYLSEEVRLVVKEQWEQFVPDPKSCSNLDSVYYKIYYTINNRKDSVSKGRSLFLRISQVAAILIVGVLIATSIFLSNKGGRTTNNQTIEFISHSGFRNQFKLPDGSSGWLGYGSELKYHVDSNDHRIIDLDGLAFFNVTHHQKQPFIVKTPTKLNVEVLGTRFNVSSYSEDNTCEIILEQGSVSLNLQNRNLGEMHPDERVIYNPENNTLEKSRVDVADYLAWKDGKLILNDVSLKETCLKLSRFYNVDIVLQTEGIDNQKVRLVLEDESLENALKLLTLIVPIKFRVEERTVLENNSYLKKKIIIKNK
jgi:ferric-dicitrate binding protein FerR (iron transport regulator)